MRKKRRTLTPAVRKRLYEVSTAAMVVAVGYGLIDNEHSLLWLALIAAVLGVARVNVNPTDAEEPAMSDVDREAALNSATNFAERNQPLMDRLGHGDQSEPEAH